MTSPPQHSWFDFFIGCLLWMTLLEFILPPNDVKLYIINVLGFAVGWMLAHGIMYVIWRYKQR